MCAGFDYVFKALRDNPRECNTATTSGGLGTGRTLVLSKGTFSSHVLQTLEIV